MSKKSRQRQGSPEDYRELIAELGASGEQSLTGGGWKSLQGLRPRIGTRELSRGVMALVGEDRCDEAEGVKDRIMADVLAHLVGTGRYERRGDGAGVEVRLRPSGEASAPVPGEGGSPGPADGGATGWEDLPPATLVPVAHLKPHPMSCLVPRMRKKQWEPFLAHVARHGVREAILITKDGKIIDGLSRTEAAKKSGQETIPARVVDWHEKRQEVYMLEAALRRRHLTEDQQAVAEERLRKREAPRMRQERAQKGGRAGGRGRAKQADSSPDTASGELSSPAVGGAEATNETLAADPPKAVPERKRRAAREVDQASPEMGDRVLAGEVSLGEAKRELREQGKLPPARAPKLGGNAGMTPPPQSPTASPDDSRPGAGLPLESGAALADALIAALGIDRALALLREAVAAVEARRTHPVPMDDVGANGVPPEEPNPAQAAEVTGGEGEPVTSAEEPGAAPQ